MTSARKQPLHDLYICLLGQKTTFPFVLSLFPRAFAALYDCFKIRPSMRGFNVPVHRQACAVFPQWATSRNDGATLREPHRHIIPLSYGFHYPAGAFRTRRVTRVTREGFVAPTITYMEAAIARTRARAGICTYLTKTRRRSLSLSLSK